MRSSGEVAVPRKGRVRMRNVKGVGVTCLASHPKKPLLVLKFKSPRHVSQLYAPSNHRTIGLKVPHVNHFQPNSIKNF